MQEENKPIYEFMNNGCIETNNYNTSQTIRELGSPEAVEYIDTVGIHAHVLCEELCEALKIFSQKNNKVTKLLFNYYHKSFNKLLCLIDISGWFKYVTHMLLDLCRSRYENKEIDVLGKILNSQTNVKILDIRSNYSTISKIVECIKYNETITDIKLTIINKLWKVLSNLL